MVPSVVHTRHLCRSSLAAASFHKLRISLLLMEEDDESRSNTNSFKAIEMLQDNVCILDSTKKRKLQSELFDLPVPKHTCLSRSSPSSSTVEGYPVLGHLQPIIIRNATDVDGGSQPGSAGGSNSFNMEEYSSTLSVSAKLYVMPSCSDGISGYNSSENQTYSSDGKEDINSLLSDGPINLQQILEEQLLEFGTCMDYNGSDLMEQCGDNETEGAIYSKAVNPNSYVLSSGRWNVEREEQATTRKPTIDKEFEQYFSMLML